MFGRKSFVKNVKHLFIFRENPQFEELRSEKVNQLSEISKNNLVKIRENLKKNFGERKNRFSSRNSKIVTKKVSVK